MDISKNIISIRESKGIKQYEVAEKLGIEPPNYSRLEKRGDKLTVEQLKKIADALGVDYVDFFGISSIPQNDQIIKRVEELEQWIKDKEFIINNLKLTVLNLQSTIEQFCENLEWSVAEYLKLGHVKINDKIEPYDFEKGMDFYEETYNMNDPNSKYDVTFILTDEDKNKVLDFIFSNEILVPLISVLIQYKQDLGVKDLWTKRKKSPIKIHNKDYLHKGVSLYEWVRLREAVGELKFND